MSDKVKKYDVCLFLINTLIIMITFFAFFRIHFSLDSYSVYYNTDAKIQITQNSRYISYLIIKLFNSVGFNPVEGQGILTAAFMAVSGLSVTLLAKLFAKYLSGSGRRIILIDLACLFLSVNIFVLEWYIYAEIMLYYAISLLAAAAAVLMTDSDKKYYIKYPVIILLLVVSLGSYQVCLPVYLIYALTLVYFKNKEELNRKSVSESVMIIAASGISFLLMVIVNKIFMIMINYKNKGAGRMGSPDVLITNLKAIIGRIGYVFEGMNILPVWCFPAFFILTAILLLYLLSLDKPKMKSVFYALGLTVLNFCIIFMPHLLTKKVRIDPRTLLAAGAFCSFLMLMVVNKIDVKRKQSDMHLKAGIIIAALFLFVNFIRIQAVAQECLINNALEREYAVLYQSKIDKYEEKTGIEIKNIGYCYDERRTYKYGAVKYGINTKAYVVDWGAVNAINYYNDKSYKKVSMDENIYNEYFAGKDWNVYDSSEQIVFDNDTMYICFY